MAFIDDLMKESGYQLIKNQDNCTAYARGTGVYSVIMNSRFNPKTVYFSCLSKQAFEKVFKDFKKLYGSKFPVPGSVLQNVGFWGLLMVLNRTCGEYAETIKNMFDGFSLVICGYSSKKGKDEAQKRKEKDFQRHCLMYNGIEGSNTLQEALKK